MYYEINLLFYKILEMERKLTALIFNIPITNFVTFYLGTFLLIYINFLNLFILICLFINIIRGGT